MGLRSPSLLTCSERSNWRRTKTLITWPFEEPPPKRSGVIGVRIKPLSFPAHKAPCSVRLAATSVLPHHRKLIFALRL